MPSLFLVTDLLFRVPLVGRIFRFLIPVANYVHEGRLNRRQRYRWCLLDTFDMLTPSYDTPLTEREARQALTRGGLVSVKRLPNDGLNLMGRSEQK